MVPKNTPFCTACGKHRTTHESGICSICRKRKNFRPCIRCGERKAQAADGICSVCRTSLKNQQDSWLTEDQAIERSRTITVNPEVAPQRGVLHADFRDVVHSSLHCLYHGYAGA